MKLIFLQGTITNGTEAVADSTAIADGVKEVSVLELLMDGGWYIMIPLALLSIIAIYIFVERTLLDAFLPFNATLSTVRSIFSALCSSPLPVSSARTA